MVVDLHKLFHHAQKPLNLFFLFLMCLMTLQGISNKPNFVKWSKLLQSSLFSVYGLWESKRSLSQKMYGQLYMILRHAQD